MIKKKTAGHLEGWLSKRSPVFLMGWQVILYTYKKLKRRYCVIEEGKFYYFPN